MEAGAGVSDLDCTTCSRGLVLRATGLAIGDLDATWPDLLGVLRGVGRFVDEVEALRGSASFGLLAGFGLDLDLGLPSD